MGNQKKERGSEGSAIEEILEKECCLICANLCNYNYCAKLHHTLKEQQVQGKPCEEELGDSRFSSVLSDYQVTAIQQAILRARAATIKETA